MIGRREKQPKRRRLHGRSDHGAAPIHDVKPRPMTERAAQPVDDGENDGVSPRRLQQEGARKL